MATATATLTRMYIDGKWCPADDGRTLGVINPATEEVIADVAYGGRAEAKRAVEAAHRAMKDWMHRTAYDRAKVLKKTGELMRERADAIARTMTLEQGKPLAEAKGEVLHSADTFEWFAEEGKRAYGEVVPAHAADKRIVVLKQPIGVVAAITPWNFPSAMITRKLAPALAAGCTVVLKPASATPYSALALAALAEEAGVPAGVFNVVTGSARAIAGEMTRNPVVQKISFTGSTEIGRELMRDSAETIKKLSLELGGNAPFLVFDDADIDAAVDGALVSKFRNGGQTCVCTNRFYVQDGVYDEFVRKLSARVAKLKVGYGLDAGTEVGPLIDAKAVTKVEEHLQDAVAGGAKVLVGGERSGLGESYFLPTVISDVTAEMKIAREGTFGPLAGVIRFKDEAEAIRQANDSEYGLASYFYARDISRVWRVAEALEAGMVGINTGLISTEVAPFGGVKQSGLGREGSRHGLDDYMEIKYLCMGV